MELPDEIKAAFGGSIYINIGDETCCCFEPGSIFLFRILEKYPILHKAIIEAIRSAANGHYSVGILVYSQLMSEYNCEELDERNHVAHHLLEQTPSKEQFEKVRNAFREVATKKMIDEFYRYQKRDEDYRVAFDNASKSLVAAKSI